MKNPAQTFTGGITVNLAATSDRHHPKDIFTKKDEPSNYPQVDVILDEAANKGTGKWTSQSALIRRTAVSLITESVFLRYVSSERSARCRV